VQFNLPKLLVEGLELAEKAEIQIQGNAVTVEITGSLLDEICRQTDSQPKTHKQVGCLMSSAIACALAKTTGKPVTIQDETRNQETKITRIEYQILEAIQSITSGQETNPYQSTQITKSSTIAEQTTTEPIIEPESFQTVGLDSTIESLSSNANTARKIQALKNERAQLTLELEKLGKIAETKANTLETEIATIREEKQKRTRLLTEEVKPADVPE
jgi:hypothetical protein